jgi:hypothetical protein
LSAGDTRSDRKLLLIVGSATLLLVAAVCTIAPAAAKEDTRPTSYNADGAGAKAAFLTLQGMGRDVQRWERPTNELDGVDAARTTLVLAEPMVDVEQIKEIAPELKAFMERGGRVLLAGGDGALLPEGATGPPGMFQNGLCETTPEGPGALAAAGQVEISERERWMAEGPQFRVEQRCGRDAVVVRYPVGGVAGEQGEAVWWSSATPLSNAGLKTDANLKLLLASVGNGRTVLFDEYLHTAHGTFDPTKGLPLVWLVVQAVLVFVLLVLSFSRRKGPLRMPVVLPRSSPLEFAESMGDLYAKAGATGAATAAAERRLVRMLHREAGVAWATVKHGPQAVGEALQARLGGDWSRLMKHLSDAAAVSETEMSPRSALALVRALAEDEADVKKQISGFKHQVSGTGERIA